MIHPPEKKIARSVKPSISTVIPWLSTGRNALVFDPDIPHTRSYRHLSSFKYPEVIDEFNIFLKKHSTIIKNLKLKYKVEDEIKGLK